MAIEGGCYCGALRYSIEGEMPRGGLCFCRACQHASGGGPNAFGLVAPERFVWTRGQPAVFTHPDKADAVTRAFCLACGTQVSTQRPGQRAVIVKIGTLDRAQDWSGPGFAIYTAQKAPWHVLPEGLPAFADLPPR
ncbi:GFA family protein [Pararhodobacter zhoushanensis]|uniref:GFA family protein n=1 Tax=Pararhodobacter zhoushanensis TaxID=2479545 RepID=UPI000F8F2852|nr:GFA family protein [Pararhodobacter zhoushanensis]